MPFDNDPETIRDEDPDFYGNIGSFLLYGSLTLGVLLVCGFAMFGLYWLARSFG